ncbi:MAG: hypothetical protein ACI3ZI_01140, partial [Candidatus Cryptobacteroides sp.]
RFAFVPDNNQLINIIMLKKTISYETPDMMVFEMHTEGVMCLSDVDTFSAEDLTDGLSGWFEGEGE